MEILQVTKDNALQAYKEADTNGKGLFVNLFGKKHFLTRITERIKTFEDACAELEIEPSQSHFTSGLPDEIAFRKIKVVVKALNEGWEANWNNSSERKWGPWFYLDSPGFRFDDSHYSLSITFTTCGSRLCFKSEELASYAGNQFLELYKAFMA